jgi:hypothetical protein
VLEQEQPQGYPALQSGDKLSANMGYPDVFRRAPQKGVLRVLRATSDKLSKLLARPTAVQSECSQNIGRLTAAGRSYAWIDI